MLSDGSELPYALFLGVPIHKAPAVAVSAGMTENGWIPVNPLTSETRLPGVYAVGDVTSVGTPKAGVFAEGAARVVAQEIASQVRGTPALGSYDGKGSCYIEFGHGKVGRVDVQFLSGTPPTGTFQTPTEALTAEKGLFGSTRAARWFRGPASAR